MSKVLVTGATGKVGSEVVKQLAAKGVAVRAAAHHPEKAQELAGDNVEIVKFDYSDPTSVAAALEGVDKIFLMSPPFVADPIALEKALIDAAKQAGVKHAVKLSAAGVEYNDNAPLRIVEKYLEASGLPYTIVRPSWFFQNFITGQLENIRRGTIAIPAGEGKTGFIDTRDIAAVVVTAFTEEGHTNQAYTLTGSEALDHYQVTTILSKVLDKPVKYEPVTDEQFRATTTAEQWPTEAIETLSMLYGIVRAGQASGITPTVQTVLGRPPIRFEQFAYDYANLWQ